MMPGKPTILGIVDGKPVIGNPGYPVSAVLSFETFGLPVLEVMQGLPHHNRPTITAVSARKIPSKLGREEFFRVKLGRVGERVVAAPLPRGAGSITTLTKADGIIRIPSRSEGIDQAVPVQVELLRHPARIDRTVVVIGSHDLTLDLLADELVSHNVFLSSSHVGSLGGLLALKSHSAHFATSHLLDLETGVYNWLYIKKYIPEIPVRLFHGCMREQGFIVPKGNPKAIRGFEDLLRDDVTFVNRQAGAERASFSITTLISAVWTRQTSEAIRWRSTPTRPLRWPCFQGWLMSVWEFSAAARALGLDFIPVATEQYDLVIPQEFLDDEKIITLLDIMRGETFKKRVLSLGGYGVDRTGDEILPPD